MNRAIHVVISGRVQGVGYRAWAAETARGHGLTGWVRNRNDGSVEAVFAGTDYAVNAMLDDCRKGPPSAMVSGIVVSETYAPAAPGFQVLPTA